MASKAATNQRSDFVPKLCGKCANLNAPCSKLDMITFYVGEVEFDTCGLFAPKGTPPEENPAMSTAAMAYAPATEPVLDASKE